MRRTGMPYSGNYRPFTRRRFLGAMSGLAGAPLLPAFPAPALAAPGAAPGRASRGMFQSDAASRSRPRISNKLLVQVACVV